MCSNIWIESWADRLYIEIFLYDRYAWGLEYEIIFYMFKLIMATHYPNSVKIREIYRYNRMNNCLVDVCNT